jgi:F-box protein 11
MQHVFISYSRRDSDIMQIVRDRLRAAGFNVWTDENLEIGTHDWTVAIEDALSNSCVVVALLSPDAKSSRWVRKELTFASENEVPIYPLLVRGDAKDAVPILLITAQFVDARQDLHSAVTRLIRALPAPVERPPERRPTSGQTYTVAQTGGGDFRSIAKALSAVPEGATIKVRPGLYRESLVLDKDVEIIGEGERAEIVLETTGAHCITMATDRAAVRNLTLRQRSQQSDGKSCVYVPQGQLLLENCDLTSESFCGIEICNAGAAPIIRRCAIHDSASAGVYVHSQGAGLLEDCQIYANALAGVHIREGGNPTLRGCRIYEGKEGGVFVYENGAGLLEDCQIYANARAGVSIGEGGNPTLRGCRIYEGKSGGVFVWGNGAGLLEDCQIYANALAGVEIKTGGNPTLRGCRIYEGKSSGVFVYENGAGLLEDCEISASDRAGVWVQESGEPTLRRCKITGNVMQAIYVVNGGKGTVEDCDLRGNKQGAWFIDPSSSVTRRNNQE